ncbi:Hypothetical protein A7982_01213 [Minicystis rosea]|nr:Hypothetical protein A7982_01213 [Minicystis rosea]
MKWCPVIAPARASPAFSALLERVAVRASAIVIAFLSADAAG